METRCGSVQEDRHRNERGSWYAMTSNTLTTPTPATALAGPSAIMTALQHSFRAIIFDWDGTAVVDRKEDATALAGLLEELLRLGVWAAVVTGTNFGNIDRQLCGHIAPARRRRLLICVNRGSEVYGFDRRGISSRRYLRVATSAEEQALTATADAVRDQLIARTGLDIRVIYDRLNRRKIDLIPLPEWADPPKARIGELLAAVERRLRGAGLPGGLGEAVTLAERLAREHGLPDARCTTDVKHIEIGLTDKSDAMAWLSHELLKPQCIAWQDVLIGGDEFGPIAGFPGSDDRLRVNDEAVVVSVGPEPNGVPMGSSISGVGHTGFAHSSRTRWGGNRPTGRIGVRRPHRGSRISRQTGRRAAPCGAWRMRARRINRSRSATANPASLSATASSVCADPSSSRPWRHNHGHISRGCSIPRPANMRSRSPFQGLTGSAFGRPWTVCRCRSTRRRRRMRAPSTTRAAPSSRSGARRMPTDARCGCARCASSRSPTADSPCRSSASRSRSPCGSR